MLVQTKQYFHSLRTIALISILSLVTACAEEVETSNNKAAVCYDQQAFSVSNVTVNQSLSIDSYTTGFIAENQKVFIDRNFIYQTLSNKFRGLPYILTANDDKRSDPSNNTFITFTVNRPVQLFIALDTRATPPTWMNNWQATTDIISDTDVTRRLYTKAVDNCQISLGGNGGSSTSSMYTVIVAEQSNVTPPDDILPDPVQPLAPVAINDLVSTLQFTTLSIDVLNNDLNIADPGQVLLTLPSTNSTQSGSLSIESDNRISYTPPNSNFIGDDTFSYTIENNTSAPSTTSTAEVIISIICANCVDKIIHLNWNSNPNTDAVTGYRIYTSETASSTSSLLMDIAINRAGFNVNQPSINLNTNSDLNLVTGQSICFRVSAYNSVGESELTAQACTPAL